MYIKRLTKREAGGKMLLVADTDVKNTTTSSKEQVNI